LRQNQRKITTGDEFMATPLARTSLALTCCAALALAACSRPAKAPQAAEVDGLRLAAASEDGRNWMTHGRTYSEQRYSPLDKLQAGNVATLGLAWSLELDTSRGQEATPLVIDGVMYTTTAWSKVVAINAATGEKLWQYDPMVPREVAAMSCCDVVNRGLAAWQGRLFLGTLDGRLVAIDAATGKPAWSVQTTDRSLPYTITGAPRVVKGKVIIGNGGAEYGVRGYVTAYDAETGKQDWRFYTVPGNPAEPFESDAMKKAAETWFGEWWKGGGGGTVWDAIAYDPELDLLYIGVGNGSPWNHRERSEGKGDNLFLSSIVALRPDTGEYVWHYQTTPGETWDYTATQSMILADLVVNGEPRKVLMQAPKNGFFYVLDRATGALISAKNFVPITWASEVDMATGRPVEDPKARYAGGPALVVPAPMGAHNWHPMSFSPKTGLVYIPAQEVPFVYASESSDASPDTMWHTGTDALIAGTLPTDAAQRKALAAMIKGKLVAWDPVRQQEAWHVSYQHMWNGGTLATAGNLVFQGTIDGEFIAYNATDGRRLWSFDAGNGIVAGPIAYEADGVEYIAVMVGKGGSGPLVSGFALPTGHAPPNGRVLAFRLGGTAKLPPAPQPQPERAPDLTGVSTAGNAQAGARLYADHCMVCHGMGAIGGGVLPDLRLSASLKRESLWEAVVLDGALAPNGMVAFGSRFGREQSEDIRAWVLEQAKLMGSE
jgi:quinohemoprotein ethanol dehydrogenase